MGFSVCFLGLLLSVVFCLIEDKKNQIDLNMRLKLFFLRGKKGTLNTCCSFVLTNVIPLKMQINVKMVISISLVEVVFLSSLCDCNLNVL